MKELKITWLDYCPKCGFDEYANVSTEKGDETYLYVGDLVHCPKCNHEGSIETDWGDAYVEWDEVKAESKEG
ncbi:TPA: hypothetical protein U2K45_000319 [Acinetobacter baumannii]|nr:hypothetical protein [Acinetobacter baumannii]